MSHDKFCYHFNWHAFAFQPYGSCNIWNMITCRGSWNVSHSNTLSQTKPTTWHYMTYFNFWRLSWYLCFFHTNKEHSIKVNFSLTFCTHLLLGRVVVAAALERQCIPHSFQQALIVLLAPPKDGSKSRRRWNHAIWSLAGLCVASWVKPVGKWLDIQSFTNFAAAHFVTKCYAMSSSQNPINASCTWDNTRGIKCKWAGIRGNSFPTLFVIS